MDAEGALKRLRNMVAEIHDLQGAASVLGWDQRVYMPRGGAEDRANQLSTLGRLAHEKFIAPEVGGLLESLEDWSKGLDPDSDDARLLKVLGRDYRRRSKLPPEHVAELAMAASLAEHAWEEARAKSDFAMFRPHLEKVVSLMRRQAGFLAPYEHIYDPLLDEYEPGMRTARVREIFETLKTAQVALIKKIAGRPQVDDSFMCGDFDENAQLAFGGAVATAFGYDWNRGRLDKTAHPFSITFGLGDVRITTRVFRDNLCSSLFSIMHEAGHAIYEQNIDPALARTPLESGASLGIHESQSRFWENIVGRSPDFWKFHYPRLADAFPEPLARVGPDSFYRAVNKVSPSLIRVEADEATYNLHVMLRMELEVGVMEGKIEVADLPELWRDKMGEYLGVVPANDAEGVLQDVHWSAGFGYFPTYTLGNIISAQILEAVERDVPDFHSQVARGEFAPVLAWLREKIYRHGAKFEPGELVERATGAPTSPDAYIRYLGKKYGEIYGL